MEKRGQINCYEAQGFGCDPKEIYTINLACGVTPLVHFFGGKEYASMCYRLRKPVLVTVTHANYRPKKQEFDFLDAGAQEHVLNSGLLCAELVVAIKLQYEFDTVELHWDYEKFQKWCLEMYGRRLSTQGVHV